MNVPGSLSSALQTMYFGFGVSLTTNCHFMPAGNPAPPRPFSPEAFTRSITSFGRHAERFAQAFVPLVLQIEVERVAVRLANELGENGVHEL